MLKVVCVLVTIRFNAFLASTNLSWPPVEKAKPQKRKLASSSSKEGESSEVQTKRRRKNEDAREKRPAPDEYVQIPVVCNSS